MLFEINNLNVHRSIEMFLSGKNLPGCSCLPSYITHIQIVDFLNANIVYKDTRDVTTLKEMQLKTLACHHQIFKDYVALDGAVPSEGNSLL